MIPIRLPTRSTLLLLPLLLVACGGSGPSGSVTSVAVAVATGAFYQGESRQAEAVVEVTGSAATTVGWLSTDTAVLTVSSEGLVTAVGVGSATVVATSTFDATVSGYATLTVLAGAWLDDAPDLPIPVARSAGVFADGAFYVFGGETTTGGRNAQVQVFDPLSATWSTGPAAMPVGLSNLCAVVLDGGVYIPGGYDIASEGVDTLYRYDLASGTWADLVTDALPGPRIASACVAHEGRIYLIGGSDPSVSAAALEPWVYDPAAPVGDRWTTGLAAPTTNGRYGGAVAVGEHIYFGGTVASMLDNDQAAVARYHPATDTWEDLPDLQFARAGAGLWSDGRYLFVAGGGWSVRRSDVEVYDLEDGLGGAWVSTASLHQARRTFASAFDAENRVVYAAGGWEAGTQGSLEIGRGLLP